MKITYTYLLEKKIFIISLNLFLRIILLIFKIFKLKLIVGHNNNFIKNFIYIVKVLIKKMIYLIKSNQIFKDKYLLI